MSAPEAQRGIVSFFVPTSHPDYAKKVKLMSPYLNVQDVRVEDLPNDLFYHLELLLVLSRCTGGKESMTVVEAKVQSMYFFIDVIAALVDPQALLLAKIRLGQFFYDSYLDVEMRVPSLKDAALMWQFFESCPDIFVFAKDELRQIEKNGWSASTSHRQKIEYMIVCVMIIRGYFSFYYDSTIFKPDVGTGANGIERVTMKESVGLALMKLIFERIKILYEMRSPLLSKEQQAHFYHALVALNDCVVVKFVAKVENLHEGQGVLVEKHYPTLTNKQFDQFLEILNNHEAIKVLTHHSLH
jgi:hypothetical protein